MVSGKMQLLPLTRKAQEPHTQNQATPNSSPATPNGLQKSGLRPTVKVPVRNSYRQYHQPGCSETSSYPKGSCSEQQYDPSNMTLTMKAPPCQDLGKCLPKCHHFEDKDMKGKKVLRNACVGSLIKKIRY